MLEYLKAKLLIQNLKSFVYETLRLILFKHGYKLLPIKNNFGIDIFYDLRDLLGTNVKTVVDVGANNGEYAREFSKNVNVQSYIAIEPDETLHHDLTEALSVFQEYKIYTVVLGEIKRKVNFNIATSETMNSVLSKGLDSWHLINRVIEVNQTTGDYLTKDIMIDFLKIDTQGYDLQVLKGFKSKLRKKQIKFILCEQIFSDLYHKQGRFSDLLIFMEQEGYDLVGMYNCHYRNARISFADILFGLRTIK
jgi:FkbM family methyltransferase